MKRKLILLTAALSLTAATYASADYDFTYCYAKPTPSQCDDCVNDMWHACYEDAGGLRALERGCDSLAAAAKQHCGSGNGQIVSP